VSINFSILLLSMLFGTVGVACRYMLQEALQGASFPWSTLIVNVVGSAAIGAIYGLSKGQEVSSTALVAVSVGLLGALTTHSTFSIDTLKLLEVGSFGFAAVNVVANNALSLGFCYVGFALMRSGGA
jgi:CrcB protein